MTSALLEVARDGQTSDPLLIQLYTAKMINEFMGGPVVRIWTGENEVPDEIIEAIDGLMNELPEMQAGQEKVEDAFAAWREKAGYKHGG